MISIVFTVLAVLGYIACVVEVRRRYRRKLAAAEAERRQGKGWYSVFQPSKPWPFWGQAVTTVIVGFAAFGIATALSLAATEIFRHDNVQTEWKEVVALESLQDGITTSGEVHGSFFLGIGTVYGEVGPEPAFSFYERRGAHGQELVPELVAQDGYNYVSVRQGDYTPHFTVEKFENKCHTPWWLNPIHQLCGTGSYKLSWTFFVPEGTVLHGYKLDAR